MNINPAALLAALLPSLASAGNFATCVLDRLPGSRNEIAAGAAVRACYEAYPAGLPGVTTGSGRGFFARYRSPDDCLADKARETTVQIAVSHMRNACRALYGEPPKRRPDLFDELGIDPSRAGSSR